jgi:hypothetical protein
MKIVLYKKIKVAYNMYATFKYDPYGIRTRVTAVKGRCLNRLTKGPTGGEGGI